MQSAVQYREATSIDITDNRDNITLRFDAKQLLIHHLEFAISSSGVYVADCLCCRWPFCHHLRVGGCDAMHPAGHPKIASYCSYVIHWSNSQPTHFIKTCKGIWVRLTCRKLNLYIIITVRCFSCRSIFLVCPWRRHWCNGNVHLQHCMEKLTPRPGSVDSLCLLRFVACRLHGVQAGLFLSSKFLTEPTTWDCSPGDPHVQYVSTTLPWTPYRMSQIG